MGSRRGQSLILALMVMFLLVFIGGLFIAVIARNITRAQRSGEVLTADYLSEAGVRYADDQLTYGMDGADWRPVPSFPRVVEFLETGGDTSTLAPPECPEEKDPDYPWLMRGFSRFTYGKGRFLVRVTYDPRPGDPMSKYIKIECVGRIGVVDPNDPTTWRISQPLRARKEKVAYKAIAITDYARFVTNKDRRPGRLSLGTPGVDPADPGRWRFVTSFGAAVTRNGRTEVLGAPIRVNGDLLWHGKNYIWVDPTRGDVVEVAGDILHSIYSEDNPPPGATSVIVKTLDGDFPTKPSSSPDFDTIPIPNAPDVDVGTYRDGRLGTDANGRPRGIFRLEPPLLDGERAGSRLSRYRDLTRNSGEWKWSQARREWFNTGYYGWGEGMYISNRWDVQEETSLYTLCGDWTRPGESQYWVGPYYTPPGVTVILTPYDLDNDTEHRPDMILVRDTSSAGPTLEWYDQNGNEISFVEQMVMPYPRNGVIFAEGNVRIKGTLPPNVQLTVVSGATIYIEGNILRYPLDDNGDLLPEEAPEKDSAIALLATDYVCVNTTQLFGLVREDLMADNWSSDLSSFTIGTRQPFFFSFAFGADPTVKYLQTGGAEVPTRLYVRHAAAAGADPCYMNISLNQTGVDPNDLWRGLYYFNLMPWAATDPIPPAKQYIYPLADFSAVDPGLPADMRAGITAEQKWPMWEHQVYTLVTGAYYYFYHQPGVFNTIGFQLDQNMTKANYLLSRAAVQPCDIRIEALLYAQNGSFFIIPGEWLNPDPDDTKANFDNDNVAKGREIRQRIDPRWPFYGQPLDVQITVYGAVSENVPASIADATAWMEKWGWIPPRHGSEVGPEDITIGYRSPLDPDDSESDVTVRQRGLTFVYDSHLSYPKVPDPSDPDDRAKDLPIRRDSYYRRLPIVPRLPVSPQTLYFGEPT